MALKQIKNKIIATKKTGKVTKAMQAVSAVKMRKSQERALQSRPYAELALRMLARMSEANEPILAPYTASRENGKALYIIVTSDKGLAGSVNSAVLKLAEKVLASRELDVIAIGRKAVEFVGRQQNANLVASFTNVSDSVTIEDVYKIAESAWIGFEAKSYKSVHVVYQNFVSTFEQKPTVRQILPLAVSDLAEMIADIAPKSGKFMNEKTEVKSLQKVYTIEPDAETVLGTLIPQLARIMVFQALIETKACEHSARMVAMKNATDNSKELTKKLTLMFNRKRQAAITAEVSEITGGIEAMKQ